MKRQGLQPCTHLAVLFDAKGEAVELRQCFIDQAVDLQKQGFKIFKPVKLREFIEEVN